MLGSTPASVEGGYPLGQDVGATVTAGPCLMPELAALHGRGAGGGAAARLGPARRGPSARALGPSTCLIPDAVRLGSAAAAAHLMQSRGRADTGRDTL